MEAAQDLADELERDAATRAGLADFGERNYRGALLAWAADLQGPQLNEFGRAFLRRLAVAALMRRLRVMTWLREHPEIAEVPLPRVVMISGLPRTGSTLAHNLLALADGARALLRWEIMEPTPPPEAASHASDPRIAKVQRSIDPLRGTLLERMHWVNAGEPEECAWAFLDCTSMLGRGGAAAMPRWTRQVISSDPATTYREYRRLVQLLLWRNPLPEGGTLVLKCPQIAGSLAAFAQVFPEASFVLMHRDPYRALLSGATMMEHIVAPFMSAPPRLRREQDDWLARNQAHDLAAMIAFADAQPERCVQLPYPELIDDPAGACSRVLQALGVDPGAGFAPRAQAFVARQRAGERAEPPAAYDDFGYAQDQVLSVPEVAAYCRRFGVLAERTRRTGS